MLPNILLKKNSKRFRFGFLYSLYFLIFDNCKDRWMVLKPRSSVKEKWYCHRKRFSKSDWGSERRTWSQTSKSLCCLRLNSPNSLSRSSSSFTAYSNSCCCSRPRHHGYIIFHQLLRRTHICILPFHESPFGLLNSLFRSSSSPTVYSSPYSPSPWRLSIILPETSPWRTTSILPFYHSSFELSNSLSRSSSYSTPYSNSFSLSYPRQNGYYNILPTSSSHYLYSAISPNAFPTQTLSHPWGRINFPMQCSLFSWPGRPWPNRLVRPACDYPWNSC